MPRKDVVKENHELWAWLWGKRIMTTTIHTTKTPLVDVNNRGGPFQYAALLHKRCSNLEPLLQIQRPLGSRIDTKNITVSDQKIIDRRVTLLHSIFTVIVQHNIRQDNCFGERVKQGARIMPSENIWYHDHVVSNFMQYDHELRACPFTALRQDARTLREECKRKDKQKKVCQSGISTNSSLMKKYQSRKSSPNVLDTKY